MTESARQWVGKYSERIGAAELTEDDIDALLQLAAVAAHASERIAAPLTCWLAGSRGLVPSEALEIAQQIAESLDKPRDE